ncbi:hypothetical protein RRG08_026578 [Elysia crispata]|uniref:Major facilitator superfamily (MFS) profile domain-containing protein n=1 Tax=Elysia crispata TaxID=231223 RepID=A0AAE0Y4H4_9GAST|nr:hypothetical protein RRG08_026578 [Elysia crispata]
MSLHGKENKRKLFIHNRGKKNVNGGASVALADESALAFGIGDEDEDPEYIQASRCGKYLFCQQWSFYLLLVFSCVGAGNLYIRNYFPTIAVSQGATLDQAATLVILVGLLDLISRLALGFLADTHLLKSSQIVAISHIVLGLICHLIRYFHTFPLLVFLAILIATVQGTRISMMPLIVIEVVGVEMMPQAFSISTMFGTFTVAAMNPTLGMDHIAS